MKEIAISQRLKLRGATTQSNQMTWSLWQTSLVQHKIHSEFLGERLDYPLLIRIVWKGLQRCTLYLKRALQLYSFLKAPEAGGWMGGSRERQYSGLSHCISCCCIACGQALLRPLTFSHSHTHTQRLTLTVLAYAIYYYSYSVARFEFSWQCGLKH